jgi:pimeloyl-ACP methyl ester carboxylesterase
MLQRLLKKSLPLTGSKIATQAMNKNCARACLATVIAFGSLAIGSGAAPALAEDPWKTFPPPKPGWLKRGPCAEINGIKMHYAEFGKGEPILFIHGGLGNANVWQAQVEALSAKYRVIVADTRGHGRSTRRDDDNSYSDINYGQFADDYIALLETLGITSISVVGWSDGAIIGLEMAKRNPSKVTVKGLFAHAGNYDVNGTYDPRGKPAWDSYASWAKKDYERLANERCSKSPKASFGDLESAVWKMWGREPRWTSTDLAKIKASLDKAKSSTRVVLGQYDEAVGCDHTRNLAQAIIGPDAKPVFLPEVGHFAMRQKPGNYTAAIMEFMGQEPTPALKTTQQCDGPQ